MRHARSRTRSDKGGARQRLKAYARERDGHVQSTSALARLLLSLFSWGEMSPQLVQKNASAAFEDAQALAAGQLYRILKRSPRLVLLGDIPTNAILTFCMHCLSKFPYQWQPHASWPSKKAWVIWLNMSCCHMNCLRLCFIPALRSGANPTCQMWKDWSDSGSWTVITLLFKIERSDTSGATTDWSFHYPCTAMGYQSLELANRGVSRWRPFRGAHPQDQVRLKSCFYANLIRLISPN